MVNLDLVTYAGDRDSLIEFRDDKRYQFVEGDICDSVLVNKLVKDCDVIVHFAAESHVDRSISGPSLFIQTNIIGTYTVLEAARNNDNKRFHHISTDEVFGTLRDGDAPFNEKTAYDPRSPYSASKASSDHLVMAYFHTYNLPVTISNCSNNYGPYQFPEKLIPLAVTNLIEEKNISVYGDGMQIRDWLYVEDHCEAIDLILHKGQIGEVYCIGGNSEKKNMEVVENILAAMGKTKDSIDFVKDRPGHDRRYAISFEKMKNELGWAPKVSFEDGIVKTINWYKENTKWWEPKKSK